jgi:hypothetical protein
MNEVQFVVGTLDKYWATECDIAGPSNVRDLAEGEIEIEPVEGGHFLDLVATLTLLSTAATFIKESIEIYRILREELSRNPNHDEFK